MLFDSAGRPVAPEQPIQETRLIGITRSFSYKLNLKNADGSPTYESCDFFASERAECLPEMAGEVSRDLYEFCMEQVLEDIRQFKGRRNRKLAQRSNVA